MSDIKAISHNIWQCLFDPKSVAVIGASDSPGSWGNGIMLALLTPGGRRVFPVNSKATKVLGITAYKNVVDIPESVDLAVIAVSASQAPRVLEECALKAIKAAVIISGGFSETGEQGGKIESQLVEIAQREGIRFIGPNCMGHADTSSRLSSFVLAGKIDSGPVALLSQSGNMCIRIIKNAIKSGYGFNTVVSTGNEADLCLEDYLEYLGQDDSNKIITAYVEGLREGRRFFNLAKDITTRKPIVVLKAGGTKGSAAAVKSHTGVLAGSDSVYGGAFKQSGVIRVDNDDELCDVVLALLNQPLPRNNGIGILTLGGGLGVVSAEACEKEGLEISPLLSSTIKKLDSCLPPRWSRRNPVDMAGISATEFPAILSSLSALMEDENIGAILLQAPIIMDDDILATLMNLSPGEIGNHREKEEMNLISIKQQIDKYKIPVIYVDSTFDIMPNSPNSHMFHRVGIPVCPNPHRAARVLRHLIWYRDYLRTSR